MQIYLIQAKIDVNKLDVAESFVVQANTARKARELAAGRSGDEGEDFWRNYQTSRCSVVGVALPRAKEEKVLCRDFNNG